MHYIDAHTKLLTLPKSLYTAVIFGASGGPSSSESSEYGKSSRQTNAYPRLFHKKKHASSVLYSVLGSKHGEVAKLTFNNMYNVNSWVA